LVVFGLVVIASWPFGWFIAERFVQASALSHGVLGVLTDRTRTVHEFGVVSVVGALSTGVDCIDRAIKLVAMALSASRAIRAVASPLLAVILVMLTIIMAAVVIVVATVAIVVAPLIMAIVVAMLIVIRMSSPFSFLDVGVAVCYLYQFADGRRPLAVHLLCGAICAIALC
jgi:uncharacterized BrkB/YihY/UPF0761 family membrane protein